MSQHVLTAETAREDGNTELEKEPKNELDGKSSSGVDKKPNLSSGEDTKKEDENGAKLAENPPNKAPKAALKELHDSPKQSTNKSGQKSTRETKESPKARSQLAGLSRRGGLAFLSHLSSKPVAASSLKDQTDDESEEEKPKKSEEEKPKKSEEEKPKKSEEEKPKKSEEEKPRKNEPKTTKRTSKKAPKRQWKMPPKPKDDSSVDETSAGNHQIVEKEKTPELPKKDGKVELQESKPIAQPSQNETPRESSILQAKPTPKPRPRKRNAVPQTAGRKKTKMVPSSSQPIKPLLSEPIEPIETGETKEVKESAEPKETIDTTDDSSDVNDEATHLMTQFKAILSTPKLRVTGDSPDSSPSSPLSDSDSDDPGILAVQQALTSASSPLLSLIALLIQQKKEKKRLVQQNRRQMEGSIRVGAQKILKASESQLQGIIAKKEQAATRLKHQLDHEMQVIDAKREEYEKEMNERLVQLQNLREQLEEMNRSINFEATATAVLQQCNSEMKKMQEKVNTEYSRKMKIIQRKNGMKKRSEIQVHLKGIYKG